MIVKSDGTKIRLSTVDVASPPITAIAIGALNSPPSENANADGIIPADIATVVMTIGRARLRPASITAVVLVESRGHDVAERPRDDRFCTVARQTETYDVRGIAQRSHVRRCDGLDTWYGFEPLDHIECRLLPSLVRSLRSVHPQSCDGHVRRVVPHLAVNQSIETTSQECGTNQEHDGDRGLEHEQTAPNFGFVEELEMRCGRCGRIAGLHANRLQMVTTPANPPATNERITAATPTCHVKAMSAMRGNPLGAIRGKVSSSANASPTATAAATAVRRNTSEVSCRASRPRPAPRAARMASSRARELPRARYKLATFALPRTSTSVTPKISRIRTGRTVLVI